MMILFLGATILLAEKLAVTLNTGLETFGLPPALGALLVAVLVLVPEGVGAIKAALANHVQRSMNLLLGLGARDAGDDHSRRDHHRNGRSHHARARSLAGRPGDARADADHRRC